MISLYTLKNVTGAKQPKLRVGCGRGSGKGRTCGRGHKGQYARSGHKHKPTFEGGQMRLVRRIPKRGFNQGHKVFFNVVPVASLNRFENGAEVTPQVMKEAGLVRGNVSVPVKVLGDGELSRTLTVKAQAFSQSAQRKIKKAGGTWAIIE